MVPSQLEQELAARRATMLTMLGLFDQFLAASTEQQENEQQFVGVLRDAVTLLDIYAKQCQSMREYLAAVQQALDVTEARLPGLRTEIMRRLAECDQIQGMTATLDKEMERNRVEVLSFFDRLKRPQE